MLRFLLSLPQLGNQSQQQEQHDNCGVSGQSSGVVVMGPLHQNHIAYVSSNGFS